MVKLVLPQEIANELALYVEAIDLEISGLGSVVATKDEIKVTKLHLFKQECSVGGTDLNQKAIGDFLLEAVQADEDTSVFKLHWHSHGKMDVFWSTTDEDLLQGLSASWMVGLVTNQKGAYKARLEMRVPFNLSIPLDVVIEKDVPISLIARIKAEVARKVTKIKTKVIRYKKGEVFTGEKKYGSYREYIMGEGDVIIGGSVPDEDFIGPVTREYLKDQGEMYGE